MSLFDSRVQYRRSTLLYTVSLFSGLWNDHHRNLNTNTDHLVGDQIIRHPALIQIQISPVEPYWILSYLNISSIVRFGKIFWYYCTSGGLFLSRVKISRKSSMLRKSRGQWSSGGREREEIFASNSRRELSWHLEILPPLWDIAHQLCQATLQDWVWWLHFTLCFPFPTGP